MSSIIIVPDINTIFSDVKDFLGDRTVTSLFFGLLDDSKSSLVRKYNQGLNIIRQHYGVVNDYKNYVESFSKEYELNEKDFDNNWQIDIITYSYVLHNFNISKDSDSLLNKLDDEVFHAEYSRERAIYYGVCRLKRSLDDIKYFIWLFENSDFRLSPNINIVKLLKIDENINKLISQCNCDSNWLASKKLIKKKYRKLYRHSLNESIQRKLFYRNISFESDYKGFDDLLGYLLKYYDGSYKYYRLVVKCYSSFKSSMNSFIQDMAGNKPNKYWLSLACYINKVMINEN